MKKITFLFLLSLILFSSCETEFNVNADWKEVTVVYGLLDQSKDTQYIRINKAFLGDENAFEMASVADSINYNPANLTVKIEKISSSGNVLDAIILTDTIHMKKEDGIFASDSNIIYYFENTNNFLNKEKEYKLTIINSSGDTITAQTKLIHELTFTSNNPFGHDFGFIKNDGSYQNKTIYWNHSKNAAIYQMTLFINYTETNIDGSESDKTVHKVYPVIDDDGITMKQKITGEEFFNLLKNNIEPSSIVTKRVVKDFDLLFAVGADDLKTYILLNEPPTGIVQERDLYTNIDGGIGLFSARYNHYEEGVEITDKTQEAISDSLGHLKFEMPFP